MALKPRVQVLPSPPAEPPRPAPPDPSAETVPLDFGDPPPPAQTKEEAQPVATKGKTKKPKKAKAPKPTKAAKAATPVADPAPPSSNGQDSATHGSVDWAKTPYAVVTSGARQICGAFATQDEALAFIATLSLRRQRTAYVGHFKPVEIRSVVTMG